MSRMFVFSKREQLAFLRAAITEQGQNPDEVMANEGYDFNANSEPLAMAARIVRLVSKDFLELRRYARSNLINTGFAFTAPVMYGPTPDTVRVFTNISLTGTAADDIYKYCSPFFCYEEALPNFVAQLKADLGDERRAQAWATTNRAWRRLRRYEDISIARAVSRFSNAKELGLSDHAIRNFAQHVEDMRKPVEVVFADKPEDFITMYGSGPSSCMAIREGGHDNNGDWRYMLKAGHCPTSFFAYHPHTRGAYVTRGNRVVARCIVYETVEGWRWGRIYPGGDMWSTKLQKMLSEQGMQQLTGPFVRECEFSIPGISANNREYQAPIPYFDNLLGSFTVKFNQATKDFHFTHHLRESKGNYNNLGNTGGILSSRHYVRLQCDHCGTDMSPEDAVHSNVDDRVFCSHEHAVEAGLFRARRNDGSVIYTNDHVNMYRTIDNELFTNRVAAEGYCFQYQETLIDENEWGDLIAGDYLGIQRARNTTGNGDWQHIGLRNTYTNRIRMQTLCVGYRINPAHAPRFNSIEVGRVRSMQVDLGEQHLTVDLVGHDAAIASACIEWLAPADGVVPVTRTLEFATVSTTDFVRIAA